MTVTSLPQARNSIPRQGYAVSSAYGTAHIGERCEGNAELHPDLPGAGQVQRPADARPDGRNFYTPGDPGRGLAPDRQRERTDRRNRIQALRERRLESVSDRHRHRDPLHRRRACGREREAPARVRRRELVRSGRPQPRRSSVLPDLGAQPDAGRRVSRTRPDFGNPVVSRWSIPARLRGVSHRSRQLGLGRRDVSAQQQRLRAGGGEYVRQGAAA